MMQYEHLAKSVNHAPITSIMKSQIGSLFFAIHYKYAIHASTICVSCGKNVAFVVSVLCTLWSFVIFIFSHVHSKKFYQVFHNFEQSCAWLENNYSCSTNIIVPSLTTIIV